MTYYAVKTLDNKVWITQILAETTIEKEIGKWPVFMKANLHSYREIDPEKDIPASRNYRDAWNDDGKRLNIDLQRAKECHRCNIIKKAEERTQSDIWGKKDMSVVDEELKALDFDSVSTLDELYNLWPASIDTRKNHREYKMYK